MQILMSSYVGTMRRYKWSDKANKKRKAIVLGALGKQIRKDIIRLSKKYNYVQITIDAGNTL